jgi:hypothetical protein
VGRETLVLRNKYALGDTVCLSALVRDLHRAHPGRYRVLQNGNYAGVFWRNNPHCEQLVGAAPPGARVVTPEYRDGILLSRRAGCGHFLTWFHEDFRRKTGVAVPVTEPKGDVHLTAEERRPKYEGRYWVVVAGGKTDMPAKVWAPDRWQAVVDALARYGIRCVQAGGDFSHHFQPHLANCVSAVGKTRNERDFFSLVHNAEGVLCGVTAAMHVAAAFDKPCVVVAGGREDPRWEQYSNDGQWPKGCPPVKVPHAFLHTIGRLECCKDRGCWRDLLDAGRPADFGQPRRRDMICLDVVRTGPRPQPRCLEMTAADEVVEAVLDYYRRGVLPPPGASAMKYWAWTLAETEAPPPGDAALPNPDLAPPPAPPPAPKPRGEDPAFAALDHPALGGKVTVCVLGYGDHLDLVRRCLASVVDTVPPARMELRVALNQPGKEVLRYVEGLAPAVLSVDRGDRPKYPAMRALFHDPKRPLTTNYVVWFDDDSWAVEPDWLAQLARVVAANHAQGCRLYGTKFVHDLAEFRRRRCLADAWFKAAPWWRGRPLLDPSGNRELPNGSAVAFATGGFWALATEVIRGAGVPDPRLGLTGGDIVIGEQTRQAGFRIKDFGRGKTPVRWSDAKPRGASPPNAERASHFPWAAPAG